MRATRIAKLITLAVESEENITKVKGGVWRKFCAVCRREYLPHESTCGNCVDYVASIINNFREDVNKRLKEQEEQETEGTPKTRLEIEEDILRQIRGKLRSAEAREDRRDARYQANKYKILRGAMMKQIFDAHLEHRLKDVKDPEERVSIRKRMREGLAPEVQEQIDMSIAQLPEEVEVAPTAKRKLQDFLHRGATKGKTLTTSTRAAKALGFSDIDSFVNAAAEFGIHPVADFMSGGAATRTKEQISRRLREEGELPTPELEEGRPFQFAAWNAKDITRLRRLLKNRRERGDLEAQIGELEKAVAELDQQVQSLQSDMTKLDELEKKSPERMSDIYKARGHLRSQLKSMEEQRQERMNELEAVRSKLEKTPAITF